MSGGPGGALEGFGAATRAWFEGSFGAPTEVQARGWPKLAAGEHVLMVAPTGSGKTLAAFLASLDRLHHRDPADEAPGYRVVYVSPLKALAHDIERNLRAPLVGIGRAAARLGETTAPVRVDVRTGDTPQKERARQKRAPGEILVTTPESLYLILTSQAADTLKTVQTVILDEIHVLAGTKRGVHLAVSLERLAAVAEHEPQRVGLSATQRPLEVAARFLGGDREVAVVDTSQPPALALEIVVPVEDMENPPLPDLEVADDDALDGDGWDDDGPARLAPPMTGNTSPLQSGIWPSIHPRLLDLIRTHRSTLVFVNSRLLCERLTQALNERAGEELVRAHHGSISHEQRARIEDDLKAGRIPALVATSSLELGIDMGAIDLVVLVESPGSTARGLQRIGRAGHQVGARSEGRIFPKYRGDLLESAVVAARMATGDIEATRTPRNCLDVLAQQVVAIVSEGEIGVDEVFALVTRAAPYATLSRDVFAAVLDMLSGRYPSDAFADLSPILVWDRTTDVLSPRRGARLRAVLNAGTIPDRGLYRVRLGGDGARLGELDEEMVFESRPGDVILLGASSWRIDDITRDEVHVTPAPGQPGRLPFWRGERPGRPLELGRALGAWLRELDRLDDDAAEDWLQAETPLDPLAARNLVAYVREQRAATGTLPTDEAITVERFRDDLGDWRVVILTPFGSRLHTPWALALQSVLSSEAGFDVDAFWSDDGVALRFADTDALPDVDSLFPDPDDLEDLVVEQLRHAALFASRFREAAARALLLPRRRGNGRTPLWLQRKRASELMAVAQRFPSFPIVLETYRECLQDVFDLPALTDLLRRVRSRAIRVDEVETRSASPFARGLVFQYIAAYLYDGDAPLAERKAAALSLDRQLLRELLGQDELRDLLDAGAVDAVERELQHLDPDRHARHEDALHDLLRRLGDLAPHEVVARCAEEPSGWLDTLERQRRAAQVRIHGEIRWIAAEDAGRYRDALGVAVPPGLPDVFLDDVPEALPSLLRRFARTRGPFHTADVAHRYGLHEGVVDALLRTLEAQGVVVHGALRPGGTQREWCDADVLRRLRRRSLAVLRDQVEPVDDGVYARFLLSWHGVASGAGRAGGLPRLHEAIDKLEGVAIPFGVLEREVLPARVPGYQPILLDQLGAMGEVVWTGCGALGTRDGKIALLRRERAALLRPAPDESFEPSPLHQALLDHLETRGACFLVQLQDAAPEASLADVTRALWDLVWAGRVTNDTLQPLRALSAPRRRGAPAAGGRWSRVDELVRAEPAPTEILHARAVCLLERYGVVSREAVVAEGLPGGFSALYPVLREMEAAGRVRRGWFVDGFGGAQFALPGAVDRLRGHRGDARETQVVGATDPALAWGALLPWPATVDASSRPRRAAGCRVVLVDGQPALHLGKGDKRAILFRRALDEDGVLEAAVQALSSTLDHGSLGIEILDGVRATDHAAVGRLCAAGFQRDHHRLLLVRRR